MTISIAERATGEQAHLSPGLQEIIDGFDAEHIGYLSGNVAVAQATDFQLMHGSPEVVESARSRLEENLEKREEAYLETFERLMDSASGPSAPDIVDEARYWSVSESYMTVDLRGTSYQYLRDWLGVANKHEPDMSVTILHKTLDVFEERFDKDGFAQMLLDLGAAEALETRESSGGTKRLLRAETAYIHTLLRDLVRDAVASGDLEIIERCADTAFIKTYALPSVALELECGRARCLTTDRPDDGKLFYGAITEQLRSVVATQYDDGIYREDIDNALKAVIGEYVDHVPSSVAQLAASIDDVTKRDHFWKAVGVHIIKMDEAERGPEYTELLEQAKYSLSLYGPVDYAGLLMHQAEYSDLAVSAEQVARVVEHLEDDEWLGYHLDLSLMLCAFTTPAGLVDLINAHPQLLTNFPSTEIAVRRLASNGLASDAYQVLEVKPEEDGYEDVEAFIRATKGFLVLYGQTGDEQAWGQAQLWLAKLNPANTYDYIAVRHDIAVSAFISAHAQSNRERMAEAEAAMRSMLDPVTLMNSNDPKVRSQGFAQRLRGLGMTARSFVRAGLLDYAKDYSTRLLHYSYAYKELIEKDTWGELERDMLNVPIAYATECADAGRTADTEEFIKLYTQLEWPYSKELFACLEHLATTSNSTNEGGAEHDSTTAIIKYEIRQLVKTR